MIVNKKVSRKSAIKASNARIQRRRQAIKADDEVIEDEVIDNVPEEGAGVSVAPEASDLLFEAEDVAELLAEVTGQDIAVEADENTVTFEIGEDQFVVEAEGDEEILEATKKPLQGKKPVKASKRVAPVARPARKPVARRTK